MRRLLPLVVLAFLLACAPSPAPTSTPLAAGVSPATVPPTTVAPTPTIDIAPTQTRAAELAQLATLTAPSVTSIQPPTIAPAPATATPTAMAIPPTTIPAATPIPGTPTPVQASVDGHRRWFANKRRTILGSGAEDVTGDGTPDYLYRSSGEGCASCHGTWITVFMGDRLLFDEGTSDDGTVAIMADHLGFLVTETLVGASESFANASGRATYTYRYAAGSQTLTDRQATLPPTPTSSRRTRRCRHESRRPSSRSAGRPAPTSRQSTPAPGRPSIPLARRATPSRS